MRIACGMTTAPRQRPALSASLRSVREAGYRPTLYGEPLADLSGVPADVPVVHRPRKLGAWHNWYEMACELAETDCDLIVTFQDDIELSPVAFEMMRRFPWPEDCGVLSLYTPTRYHQTETGWVRIVTESLWGACAWVFQRDRLRQLLATPTLRSWRGFRPVSGMPENQIANIDIAMGDALNSLGLHCYCHRPGLCQHIGETSTITSSALTEKRTSAPILMGLPEQIGLETTTDAWRARTQETHFHWLRKYLPPTESGSLLDVGGGVSAGCRYLEWFAQFEERTSVELCEGTHTIRGVNVVFSDFREWDPEGQCDVVLCLDVLQEIPEGDRRRFIDKLFRLARRQVVTSLPVTELHGVDPARIWGRTPEHYLWVTGKRSRLLCNFRL